RELFAAGTHSARFGSCLGYAGVGGPGEPLVGLLTIERTSAALFIEQTEAIGGIGIPALGGLAQPPGGFRGVGRHTIAFEAHDAEFELAGGIASFRTAPAFGQLAAGIMDGVTIGGGGWLVGRMRIGGAALQNWDENCQQNAEGGRTGFHFGGVYSG